MKQQKTTQTFPRHPTGKVQQPMTTETCWIKKIEKKEYKVKVYNTRKLQPKTTQINRTEKMGQRRSKRNSTMKSMSGARLHNRIQQKNCEQRSSKTNSTRTSISGAPFHKGRQQKYCEQRRSETNSTRPTISQAKFHSRRLEKFIPQRRWKINSRVNYLTGKVPQTETER